MHVGPSLYASPRHFSRSQLAMEDTMKNKIIRNQYSSNILSGFLIMNLFIFLLNINMIYILAYPRICIFGKMVYGSITVSRIRISIQVSVQRSLRLVVHQALRA
jgi:hypothetical protein